MSAVHDIRSYMSDEEIARQRQRIVDEIHDAIGNGQMFGTLCTSLMQALDGRVWEQERILAGGTRQGPLKFAQFVCEPYPVGLGTSLPALKKMIAASVEHSELAANRYAPEEAARVKQNINAAVAKVLLLIDGEMERGPGNQRIEEQPRGEDGRVQEKTRTVDNVHDTEERPTGNSKEAGLRRLRKAAEDTVDQESGEVIPGDPRAKELLEQVLSGLKSTHAACVEMGWRKAARTVSVDEAGPSGIDKEVKRDAARNMAHWLAENSKPDQWDWIKATLYTAGAKLVADAFANEIGAGVATMDRANERWS